MKIVLIEDNPGDARLVRVMVNSIREKYSQDRLVFEHFQLLQEGIREIREQGADMVMLDLALPDLSHLETLKTFRRALPNVPVIVFSDQTAEKLWLEQQALDVDGFFTKGVVSEVRLIRAVETTLLSAVGSHRLTDAQFEALHSDVQDMLCVLDTH
jgi:DNA-binding NarL/FixJ family response regulator